MIHKKYYIDVIFLLVFNVIKSFLYLISDLHIIHLSNGLHKSIETCNAV